MKVFTHWLIGRAARGAPRELSERLEEEWLADLAARRSNWSRLRFAIGCCWATQVISFEHGGTEASLVPHAAGPRLAMPFLDDASGPFSRRSATLVAVVGLHIAIFYGLLVGLNVTGKKLITDPLQNRSIDEPRPDRSPPPVPPPTLIHTKITELFPPELPPTGPTEDDVRLVQDPPLAPTQPTLPTPPHVVTRVAGGPGAGFPAAEDYYPSAAKRLEEQGVATVRVCVDAHGRLMSDPTTVASSGSARLDAGALQLAKAGSGHYRANTEDGRPVDGCYPFRVRFQLRN